MIFNIEKSNCQPDFTCSILITWKLETFHVFKMIIVLCLYKTNQKIKRHVKQRRFDEVEYLNLPYH